MPESIDHFGDQQCQITIMPMWIVLRINNSRYQSWQVSVLIWSIELSISYVSLKSDNITCVEMSYVFAFGGLSRVNFTQYRFLKSILFPIFCSLSCHNWYLVMSRAHELHQDHVDEVEGEDGVRFLWKFIVWGVNTFYPTYQKFSKIALKISKREANHCDGASPLAKVTAP